MTTEHQQAERAAFEAWAVSQGWDGSLHLRRSVVNGLYTWQALNTAWTIWQAALEWKSKERADVPPGMALVTDTERMAFLHSCNEDPEGYEYGVAKVKFDEGGAVSFLWTASDHSDIDTIISQQKRCEHKMFAVFNGNLNKRCTWCGIYESTYLALVANETKP